MNIKKSLNILENYWRPAFVSAIALLLLLGILWFRLGTLTDGVSQAEQNLIVQVQQKELGPTSIITDPLYLPHTLLLYILQLLGVSSIIVFRFISTFIGIMLAISFFLLLQKWHTNRIAVLGTTLLITSSWFLHTVRHGEKESLLLMLLIIFFAGVWLQHSRHRSKLLAFLLASALFAIYIPGLVWFVILGAIWQYRRINEEISNINPAALSVYILAGVVALSPLLLASIGDIAVLKSVLGLPEALPTMREFTRNILEIPKALFISGRQASDLWLVGTPLLDIFSAAMFVVGLYWYGKRFRLDRTVFLAVVFMIGSTLISLGGPVTITILLPFVYLVITAGITHMLHQWFTVFPRNPIARMTAVLLITAAVCLSAFYNMNRYFIAWPNAPETKRAFQQQD